MRRLSRRLFNGLGNALRLLSLLACLGIGWLWWRGRHVLADRLEVSGAGVYVAVLAYNGKLSVRGIVHWPGRAEVRTLEIPFDGDFQRLGEIVLFIPPTGWSRDRKLLGLPVSWGRAWIALRRDGQPYRFHRDDPDPPAPERPSILFGSGLSSDTTDGAAAPPGPPAPAAAALPNLGDESQPLPFFEMDALPDAVPLALAAVPPLAWGLRRGRRAWTRARRRRLGLCLRCGYDLRGNTSGQCSECGEGMEAAVERRVTV